MTLDIFLTVLLVLQWVHTFKLYGGHPPVTELSVQFQSFDENTLKARKHQCQNSHSL